jgi:hypothetical protein
MAMFEVALFIRHDIVLMLVGGHDKVMKKWSKAIISED